MNARTHRELADFIWGICNLLRGPYKRNEYRKVILPLTVLRRFDCVLADTKQAVLAVHEKTAGQIASVRHQKLKRASGRPFYNTMEMDFDKLLNDPNLLARNLTRYIREFSDDVVEIMDAFGFSEQIVRLNDKDRLFRVVQRFAALDLSPERVDNMQMGYVFEELIRIGAEQANEEAGEHFTPREVIQLMVDLLLSPEADLNKGHVVRTIYDPACGTGGMLSVAETRLREHNSESKPMLFGQDLNDEAWGGVPSRHAHQRRQRRQHHPGRHLHRGRLCAPRRRQTLDVRLHAGQPPIRGRSGANRRKPSRTSATPSAKRAASAPVCPASTTGRCCSCNTCSPSASPSRPTAQAAAASPSCSTAPPLFTGDADGGESNIRRWIITNDWLEAVVALPDQLFYNTGISTYIWVLTNRKEPHRVGHVQLIDGRQFFTKMRKSLGNKRNELSDKQIDDVVRIHRRFRPRRDTRHHRHRPDHAPAPHTAPHRHQGAPQRSVRLSEDHRREAPATQLRRHPRAHRAHRGREGVPEPRQPQETHRRNGTSRRQRPARGHPRAVGGPRRHHQRAVVPQPRSISRHAVRDSERGRRATDRGRTQSGAISASRTRPSRRYLLRQRRAAPSPTPTYAIPKPCPSARTSTTTWPAKCCPMSPTPG